MRIINPKSALAAVAFAGSLVLGVTLSACDSAGPVYSPHTAISDVAYEGTDGADSDSTHTGTGGASDDDQDDRDVILRGTGGGSDDDQDDRDVILRP